MKALVFGGSGLIGHELVLNLLQNSKLEILHFAGRKKPDFDHPKMNYIPWSLNLTASLPAELFAGANVFCCLGSTMAKAKSKDAFRAVDFDGPLGLAQRAAGAGALSFSLVSAAGASSSSMIFYNRVKGDLENAVSTLGLKKVLIYRPSLLLGNRPESRPSERFFVRIFQSLPRSTWSWIPSAPIEARDVAQAMVVGASTSPDGVRVFESCEIQNISNLAKQ